MRLNREGSAVPDAIDLLLLQDDATTKNNENFSPARARYLPGIGKKWVRTRNNLAMRLSKQGSGLNQEETTGAPEEKSQQSQFFYGNYDNLVVQNGLFLRTTSAP